LKNSIRLIAAIALVFAASSFTLAQSLNWEGQTGALVTPFAYTAKSSDKGFGAPTVAFHYLNAGENVGNYFTASATVGVFNRAEFGYTRTFVKAGSTAVSPLFDEGYNTFHGKLNIVRENAGKTTFVPAISVGFVARTNVRHVGGVIDGKDTNNGDVYLVGTKTITQVKGLPIVLSAGVRGTNASIMGIAGNAPEWTARAFGAAAFVVKGPAKSSIILGSEFSQQPKEIAGLPGAVIPTTLTYFARIVPKTEKGMNIDFGVAQVAGRIAPGVDLKSRAQFGMGVSYHF